MPHPSLTIGWVYNLETAPLSTDAGEIIAIAVCFSVLSIVSVVVRFSQRWKNKNLGLDDYSAVAGMLLGIAYSIVAIYQTRWGLGLNIAYFPLENVVGFSRVQYVGGPIYCLAILGFKLAILASYLRFAGFNRTYRMFLYSGIALVVVNQIIFTCLLSFACRPIRKQWEPEIEGTCINQLASYFALGGTSLGLDILIIILPFPILKRLQLDLEKKIALGVLFGLGFFVTAVQGIRTQTIASLAVYTDSQAIIIWSIIEINVGIFVACVPGFAPLLRSFTKTIKSSYRSRYGSSGVYETGDSGMHSQYNQKRTSKILSKGIDSADRSANKSKVVTTRNEEVADDEEVLWGKQHGWAGQWQEEGSHPMTNIKAQTPSTHLSEVNTTPTVYRPATTGPEDPRDIRVVREISIQRHSRNGNSHGARDAK